MTLPYTGSELVAAALFRLVPRTVAIALHARRPAGATLHKRTRSLTAAACFCVVIFSIFCFLLLAAHLLSCHTECANTLRGVKLYNCRDSPVLREAKKGNSSWRIFTNFVTNFRTMQFFNVFHEFGGSAPRISQLCNIIRPGVTVQVLFASRSIVAGL